MFALGFFGRPGSGSAPVAATTPSASPTTLEKSPRKLLDQDRAETLDRVGAGAVPPLARGDVEVDRRRTRARAKRTSVLATPLCSTTGSPALSTTSPPSTSWVRPESASSRARAPASSSGLPSSRPSSATSVSAPSTTSCSSPPPARAISSPARALRRAFSSTTSRGSPSPQLVDLRAHDLELDPEAREDLAPAGRRRGEDQPRASRTRSRSRALLTRRSPIRGPGCR